MKQTLVYLTDEQHEALRAKAFVQRTSITELVRQAVSIYLSQKNTVEKKDKGDMPFD